MSRAHGLSWIKRSIQSGFVHGLSPFAATNEDLGNGWPHPFITSANENRPKKKKI